MEIGGRPGRPAAWSRRPGRYGADGCEHPESGPRGVRCAAVPYRCGRGGSRARVGVDVIFVFAGCELDTDAFALARDADHTFSLASAHEQAAVLHQLRDEPTVVLDHAATALEMARAQGLRASGRHRADPLGLVSCGTGGNRRRPRRAARRDRGVPSHRGPHGPPVLPRASSRRLAAGGSDRRGLGAVDEALAESGDRDYCHAAELHRLRALLMARRGADDGDVTAELVWARDIARRQGAPLLEERVSLALREIAPVVASGETAG